MRLYLVQHGQAMETHENPDRPLSAQGRDDVAAIGQWLRQAGANIPSIEHSGKTRARETAELLARALGKAAVEERKDLAPNDPVDIVSKSLKNRRHDLMLVGHLPFMSKLASLLVTGDEYAHVLSFQQGAVVCLEREPDALWSVAWMVTPALARAAGS